MFEKVSRSLKCDSNFFLSTNIYTYLSTWGECGKCLHMTDHEAGKALHLLDRKERGFLRYMPSPHKAGYRPLSVQFLNSTKYWRWFWRQWCRDVASGANRHLDITFGLQVVDSSSLVSVHFREAFSHPYISFFHLLVHVFCVIYIYVGMYVYRMPKCNRQNYWPKHAHAQVSLGRLKPTCDTRINHFDYMLE